MVRRLSVLVGLAAVLLGIVAGPAPAALAVSPVPPPVDPSPYLTSQLARSASGSPVGDAALAKFLQMARAINQAAAAGASSAAAAAPLAAPSTLARVAGGTALVLPQLGWVVAANGTLGVVAIASGTTYEDVFCDQPQWYQGVTWAANMTMTPDCVAYIDETLGVNSDISPGTFLNFQGTTVNYVRVSNNGSNWCYSPRLTLPAGYKWAYGYNATYGGPNIIYGSQVLNGPLETNCDAWVSKANSTSSAYLYVVTSTSTIQSYDIAAQMHTADENPLRTPDCSIDWPDGTTTTGVGTPYRETTGIPFSAEGLGCKTAWDAKPGAGTTVLPSRIGVGSENEDTGARTEISSTDVPAFTETETKGLTAGTQGGLILTKVVDGVEDSCMTWAADCAGWWSETASGTSATTTTGTYRCYYASELVDLAECSIYRYTFDQQTSTPTVTNPQTGVQEQWSTGTSPGNSTSPGAAGDVAPGQVCMESWSSVANPLEWVFHPVKCALVWAFVPRQSVVDEATSSLEGQVMNTFVANLVTGLSVIQAAFAAGASDCSGLPFHLEGFGITLVDARLLASCDEPYAGTAATVRTVLTVGIAIGSFLAVLRYAAALFGFMGYGRTVQSDESSGPRFS